MFILTMMNNSILILINYKEKTSWRKTWNWHCQKVSTKRKLNFEILPVCTKIIDLNNNNFGIRNLTPWAQRDAAQCATFDQSDIAWLRKSCWCKTAKFQQHEKKTKENMYWMQYKMYPNCQGCLNTACALIVSWMSWPLVCG